MPVINQASDCDEHDLEARRHRHRQGERGRSTGPSGSATEVKIRLVNEMEQDHPMHHPFHIHGAGRFLVLSRRRRARGQPRLEGHRSGPAGETVDILLDVSNPGRWMAHCHIAEHNQSGMMFSFDVTGNRT